MKREHGNSNQSSFVVNETATTEIYTWTYTLSLHDALPIWYDEISLTGDFKLISRVKEAILKPETIGFNSYKEEDIYGGNTINEASQIFDNVLSSKATKAQTDVVLVNSAYAIHTFKQESSISDCVEIARESILSGNAKRVFKKFVELSK